MSAVELLYQAAIDMRASRVLVVNAHNHALLQELAEQSGQLDLQQHFKPEYSALDRAGLNVAADWPDACDSYDLLLLLPAKNKQQTLGWMAKGMDRLPVRGRLLIACANVHGAKSYASALEQLAGAVAARSKAKCRIFYAQKTDAVDAALAARWIDAAEPTLVDDLLSRAGLFSWERIDAGSALLLGQLPPLTGAGMDLCCGYGVLARGILEQSSDISCLHMLEADQLALACARENTQPWQHIARYHWMDAAAEPLPGGLDWVVCNPPFHTAHGRDVELGKAIVLQACRSLKRGGVLYLVANRQLPYERLLQSELQHCRSMIAADGFKVLQGVRA